MVNYLVNEWEFDRSRFQMEGNGPDKPLCNESNPAAENLDLEACRTLNRSTRGTSSSWKAKETERR